MKVTVSAIKFNAAAVCKAVNDIRFYLNGVFIAANGDVVGTDGHCMVLCSKGASADEGFQGMIVAMSTKPPSKCDLIEFDTDTMIARFLNADLAKVGAASFEMIDGRYPDYLRVVPSKPEKVGAIGIDAALLARADKVFKSRKQPGVLIEFFGGVGAVKFTCPQVPDVVLIVMPCRL